MVIKCMKYNMTMLQVPNNFQLSKNITITCPHCLIARCIACQLIQVTFHFLSYANINQLHFCFHLFTVFSFGTTSEVGIEVSILRLEIPCHIPMTPQNRGRFIFQEKLLKTEFWEGKKLHTHHHPILAIAISSETLKNTVVFYFSQKTKDSTALNISCYCQS